MKWRLVVIGLALSVAAAVCAAPPVSLVSGSAKDELAGNLRGLLLQNLPQPLYEKDNNWGHQEMVRRRHVAGKLGDLHLPGVCPTKLAHVFGSRIDDFDRRRLLPLAIECRQGCGLQQRLVCDLLVRMNFQDDMRTSLPVRMQPDILWGRDLPQ